MASVINQINVGGVEYALAHSAVAVCSDPADQVAKNATILTDLDEANLAFSLVPGVTILCFFTAGFTASNATLSVNGTDPKPLIIKSYTSGTVINVPAGYFESGRPYFLFYTGDAWQPVVSSPAVEFNTW